MIITFEYLAKAAFSQSLDNFKSIRKMIALFTNIFIFVIIKSKVINSIRCGWWSFKFLSFFKIKPINLIILRISVFSISLKYFEKCKTTYLGSRGNLISLCSSLRDPLATILSIAARPELMP